MLDIHIYFGYISKTTYIFNREVLRFFIDTEIRVHSWSYPNGTKKIRPSLVNLKCLFHSKWLPVNSLKINDIKGRTVRNAGRVRPGPRAARAREHPFTDADAALPFAKVSEGQYQFDNGGGTACTKTTYCPVEEGQGLRVEARRCKLLIYDMDKGFLSVESIRDLF